MGVVCTRFFLGFVEAAFYPGALFLLSKWSARGRNNHLRALTLLRYKRRELGQRTAILSCGQSFPRVTFDAPNASSIGLMFSYAFGSLLASAILDGMDQVMGQAAWR
jgi:MFS family permease